MKVLKIIFKNISLILKLVYLKNIKYIFKHIRKLYYFYNTKLSHMDYYRRLLFSLKLSTFI